MKFIRKAAAIALVGAMMVTTVQTAAPDVVKAQVLYETNKVIIDTSLVPRDKNIQVIEEGDTPLISTLANVQFDLDCNVDCTWNVEPEEAIKSKPGVKLVDVDKMGHVTIGKEAARGTYVIKAQAKYVNNKITEAMYRVTVRGDEEAAKAQSVILDKEKIEEQSPYVKVTDEGKGLQIDGTVKNVKLYTKVEPAYLLENDVDFRSNDYVTISKDAEDDTYSLLTSLAKGKGTIRPTVGNEVTDTSFETIVNTVSYNKAVIKCEEKEADKDGYNVLANEKLNFYIKDNEQNALPQITTGDVKWTMTYGNGEKIIQNQDSGELVETELGTFEFSNNGKKVQLKTPIKGEDAYEEYKAQINKKETGSNQITLVATIPYNTSGIQGTQNLELSTVTLSFSEEESSFSDVRIDFEKAGLIKDKDFTICEETIDGKKVPVYYFESSDSESDAINLWEATHADREGIRKFEESRDQSNKDATRKPFDDNSYYPITYSLSNDDLSLNDNYMDDKIVQQTKASGIISEPNKFLKLGTGYTVLTMETGNGNNKLTSTYILRFVSSAKNMAIRHMQYDSENDEEYYNNAVIHVRQGEADIPTIYVSGVKKKLDLFYDPFIKFTFTELSGKNVASATYDSTTQIQKINGLLKGKVKVTATSVVDKTKKASYVLYVNNEFLKPEEIQIDNSDAVSLGVMDAKGNVNGHYENIPLKVRASGTSVGVPPVEWSSEDEKFATITQDGLLTTLKSTGDKTVTITATSKADPTLKATLELHIKDVMATGISTIGEKVKEGDNAVVTMGGANAGTCKAYSTFQLYAKEYLPSNATKADGQIIWESSDKQVASIDASGNVMTYAEGNTVITAKYTSGDTDPKTTVFNLTVKGFADVIESIECASTVELTRVKDSFTLVPVVKPDNASNKQLMYESQNPSIATVTDNGVITAVAPGTTTIVISSVVKPSVKKEVTVTVKGEADLKPNATPQPQQPAVQPTAPAPAATNAQSGNNTGVNEQQTKATQKKPVIKLAKKVIKKKKSTKIIVRNKVSGAKVSYKIAKKYKKIVSVSKKGKVTAKKKGTAKIVVTVKQSGKTFKKTLTIKVK